MSSSFSGSAWPVRSSRRWLGVAVLGGHALLLWALLQLKAIETVVQQAAPLMVHVIAPAPERMPAPAPPLRVLAPRPALAQVVPALPVPEVPLQREGPTATVAVQAAPAPAAPTLPAPQIPPALHAVPTPQATAPEPPLPPRPAAVQQLPPGALRYRVEPPVVVPRASRRRHESGTVLLHVVVDLQGLPRSVLLHRSSGFERLDEQALGAMRQARFFPCTEGGKPVECESIAPIVYELEN